MDTILRRNRFFGLVVAALLLVSGFALTACGADEHVKTGIVEGEPVKLGQLEYNVLFTRPLNPNDIEDSAYLEGKEPAPPQHSYIGVFLKVRNLDKSRTLTIPDSFTITDTAGKQYQNLPTTSVYALEPGSEVDPEGQLPQVDSIPQVGPIQASMLLFKITDESMEHRPVVLTIEGDDGPAEVDLDL